MLNQPGFVPYTLLDSSILVQRKAGREEYRLSTSHPDTLLIKETKAKRWQRLYKPSRRNTIAFTTIEYTQLTSFDSFAASITNEGQVDLTIIFHPTIEVGHYQGQLNEKYRLLLQELLASFDPRVEPVFNPYIISDIQEWAAILHTETAGPFQLYHDYQGIDPVQQSLANYLGLLPTLIPYQKIDKSRNETQAIQDFRKDEAHRNLQDFLSNQKE